VKKQVPLAFRVKLEDRIESIAHLGLELVQPPRLASEPKVELIEGYREGRHEAGLAPAPCDVAELEAHEGEHVEDETGPVVRGLAERAELKREEVPLGPDGQEGTSSP